MRPLVDRSGEPNVAKLVSDLNAAMSSGLKDLGKVVEAAAEASHTPEDVAAALDTKLSGLRKDLVKAIEQNSPSEIDPEELSGSIVGAVSKELKRLLKEHEAPGVTEDDVAAIAGNVGATIDAAVSKLTKELVAGSTASQAESSKLLAQVTAGFGQVNEALNAQADAVRSLGRKKARSVTTPESIEAAVAKVAAEQASRNLPAGVKIDRDGLEMCIYPNVQLSRMIDPASASTVSVRDGKGAVRFGTPTKLPATANVVCIQLGGRPIADAVCAAEAAYVASGFDADTKTPAVVVFSSAPRAGEKPQQSVYESLHRMLSQAKSLSVGGADHVVIGDGSKVDLVSLAAELKGARFSSVRRSPCTDG